MSSEGFCQFLTRMRLDRLPSFVTFASTSLVSSSKEVEFTPGTHSRAAILGGRLIHRQSNVPSVTSLINHSSGSGFSLPNIPFRSFTLSRSGQPYHALYNRAVGFSASHYFIVLCTTKSVLLLVQLPQTLSLYGHFDPDTTFAKLVLELPQLRAYRACVRTGMSQHLQ